MLHDEKIFPEPQRFMPERFLNEDGSLRKLSRHEDPSIIGFGFGRRYEPWVSTSSIQLSDTITQRICPGMYFAHNSIFIAVARMLYVFGITKAHDELGHDIVPAVEYDGFIRYVYAISALACSTVTHFGADC